MPFLAAATLWLVVALTSFAPAHVPASFASAQKPASLASAQTHRLIGASADRLDADTSREPASLPGARPDRYEQPSGQRDQGRRISPEGPDCRGYPLEDAGARSQSAQPGRAVEGHRRKRPLLLLAHTDVVGVQRDKWPVDPFGAVLRDGYIWGRGTTDDKDNLTANLMAFLLAKRAGTTARARSDLPRRIRRGGRPDRGGHPLPRRAALRRDRRGIRAGRRSGCRDRGRTRAPRADCHDREAAPAGATGRHGYVRPRLDSTTRQPGDASGQRGAEDWHVEHADAAQRHHAAVLREARDHQHARARRALSQSRQRPGRRQRPSAISPNTNPSTMPSCGRRSCRRCSRPASGRTSFPRRPRRSSTFGRCPTKTCRVS